MHHTLHGHFLTLFVAHSFGCDLRNGTDPQARNLCFCPHLHDPPILSIRAVVATDRIPLELAIYWSHLWNLGGSWHIFGSLLLFSATTSQFQWAFKQGSSSTD